MPPFNLAAASFEKGLSPLIILLFDKECRIFSFWRKNLSPESHGRTTKYATLSSSILLYPHTNNSLPASTITSLLPYKISLFRHSVLANCLLPKYNIRDWSDHSRRLLKWRSDPIRSDSGGNEEYAFLLRTSCRINSAYPQFRNRSHHCRQAIISKWRYFKFHDTIPLLLNCFNNNNNQNNLLLTFLYIYIYICSTEKGQTMQSPPKSASDRMNQVSFLSLFYYPIPTFFFSKKNKS